MKDWGYMDVYLADYITAEWEMVARCRKPVIAAVAGYALGGGCELAMMCDFILAGDNARFGQPEINLGILPGAGGTQRLPRFVGKSKAMEMVLLGQARMMDAAEAERCGLVSRVVPVAELVEEAVRTAQKIAELSLPIVMMAKESVNRAGCSTPRSPPRTRRKAWRRSPTSASPPSKTASHHAGHPGCRRHEKRGWFFKSRLKGAFRRCCTPRAPL
jgi:enoyl-CoA hydratase